MPRKPKKEITYLTEQEIDAFFRTIRSTRDKALFRVMYHHGLRASEPGKLMLSDFRPGPKPRLRITRLKGSITGAEHLLLDLELSALRAWLRIRGTRPGPLFLSRKHCAIGPKQIHRLMRRYCILAAIPLEKAHPHALKHSCGTHMVKLTNGDVIWVQDHMGHADIRSTMRYIRVTDRRRGLSCWPGGSPKQSQNLRCLTIGSILGPLRIVQISQLGGLHHRYERIAA